MLYRCHCSWCCVVGIGAVIVVVGRVVVLCLVAGDGVRAVHVVVCVVAGASAVVVGGGGPVVVCIVGVAVGVVVCAPVCWRFCRPGCGCCC